MLQRKVVGKKREEGPVNETVIDTLHPEEEFSDSMEHESKRILRVATSDEMMAVLKTSHNNQDKDGECTVYNIHWRVTTFPGTAMCKSVSVPCLSARQVFIQAGYETLCVLYTWCEAFLCTDGLDSLNILITLNCLN